MPPELCASRTAWYQYISLVWLLAAHGDLQDITLVTVDNPHTTKNLLKEAFPQAKVMMDIGHVLFSRCGKRFDKSHPLYRE
jgi:hypothetical protein